ncbi:hypothetical protein ACF1G5_15565 [Streptomyces coeruleorubidus]|uniref:hypothetical protein n=1 Tax=Streptomyces coeruleorubidus TaxID=116188 RepID=UPI0036F8C2C6
MGHKAWGFLLGLLTAGTIGWALAGMVDVGCGPSRRGHCGVPEGGGWYFAAFMTAPWLFVFFARAVTRDGGWRPTVLGISAGLVVGIAFALSKDPMPPRMWVLIVVLAALAVGAPLALSRLLRTLRPSHPGPARRPRRPRRWQA